MGDSKLARLPGVIMRWLSSTGMRLFEETLPFLYYLNFRRQQLRRASGPTSNLKIIELPVEESKKYLEREHDRGRALDEKTFKLAGSASLAQTIIGSLSVVVSTDTGLAHEGLRLAFVVSVVFAVMSGLISLGALRTLPLYGYGAAHLKKVENEGQTHLAEMCARQGVMNILRHGRNELAFMSLRNGIIVLSIAWVLVYAIRVYSALCTNCIIV